MPRTGKTTLVEISRDDFWLLQKNFESGLLQIKFGEIIQNGRIYTQASSGATLFKDDGMYYWAHPTVAKLLRK